MQNRSANHAPWIFWSTFAGLLVLLPLVVLTINAKFAFIAVAGLVFSYALATVRDEYMPIIVLLALAMGSCFRLDIIRMSFYVRFFVLGVIALKSLWMFFGSHRPDPGIIRWTSFHWIFLFISLYGMIGSLYSYDPILSFQRAVSFMLLFLAICHYFWIKIHTQEQIRTLLVALWKTILIIMLVSLALSAVFPGQMRYGGRWRLVFFSPNQLGHFASMMSPIAIWYYFEGARKKWLAGAVLAFIGLALLGSGSRSAILGSMMGAGCLFWFCYRRQAIYLLGVMVLLFSGTVLLKMDAPDPNRPDSFIEEHVVRGYSLKTGSGRTGVWKSAWQLIKKKPVFGYGFGITDKLFRMKMFDDLPIEFQGGHTHNSYIEEFVNLGFLGGTAFIIIVLILFSTGIRPILMAQAMDPEYRLLFVTVFASMFCGFMSSLFESWFTSVGSFFCFPFWLLGLMLMRLNRIHSFVSTRNP